MQKTERVTDEMVERAKTAWNSISDEHNGWDALSQEERDTYVALTAALSSAEEKAVEVKDVLTIVGADGREWVPKDALLAALVDVPAVESEPVAWYIERNGERHITDNDIIRDRWVGLGRHPIPLLPPRSSLIQSEEGEMIAKEPSVRRQVEDEFEILQRLSNGDTIVFSLDGDMAWFTKGDRAFVGNAIMRLREKGYLLRKRDVVDDDDDPRGIADYDTISDAGRLALSTRKGSADGSASGTNGGDHG